MTPTNRKPDRVQAAGHPKSIRKTSNPMKIATHSPVRKIAKCADLAMANELLRTLVVRLNARISEDRVVWIVHEIVTPTYDANGGVIPRERKIQ